ncbi:MAG: aminopeptidase N [Bdellovibrio sp. CG11_big_fil_rev_8_21_14_0_20_39_38]|nr:MAG: aminopeptidase N [Bdellovibrio sp. CG22_combo_CG10-13_8_21_14_all_39_27]PIR35347.1 MAG: aminopeptidase N [Bdellovibrio sp. CG11_big_fil_rev_8_21_14_0_20_39_38]
MKEGTPQTVFLKDYSVPPYLVDSIDLDFRLHLTETVVTAETKLSLHPDLKGQKPALFLNGEGLKLNSISIDREELREGEYQLTEDGIVIPNVPDSFTLKIVNTINPEANTALDGLYKSGNILCTQNEPQGFRHITYYTDRPDVMTKFTTTIHGNKKDFPILLSNGNCVGTGDHGDGTHWAKWEDPFRKPCYLYALVAGDLGEIKDHFTTKSGRKVDLRIYCDKGNEEKCWHAMESLKQSMKWDEDRFGLEYDLDIFMIVSVDSFNFGAMENKGLNIFNSSLVLAKPETATDGDYIAIQSVVGHEYFHNWTGNRVTCRDWFQLTLKEGLTVFRDQEFTADMNSRTVHRISDVDRLRSSQFVEDAGPTSHPIKPSSYIEINNFYTATVYEKGAEVIRMIATLLGPDGFRRGMDKYFELNDGKAVTTEDFIHAMSVANDNYNFDQFKRWYFQAGTPEVEVRWDYDKLNKTLSLHIEQSCPPTPEQDRKSPFFFPFKIGLVDAHGKDIALKLKDSSTPQPQIGEGILHISESESTFVFSHVDSEPVISLNRNFTAPVKVHAPYQNKDLAYLLANDSDEFNRYESGQVLAERLMFKMVEDLHDGKKPELDKTYIESWGILLANDKLDPAIKAECLSIPAQAILNQGYSPIDYQAIHSVRLQTLVTLAQAHTKKIHEIYEKHCDTGSFKTDHLAMGRRALKNWALGMLALANADDFKLLAHQQFTKAGNMTDELSALKVLSNIDCEHRSESIVSFYNKWKHETLVMQKWLAVQASSILPCTYDDVIRLEKDPVYNKAVPNLFRNLWMNFAMNYTHFHHEAGRGYHLVADKIIDLDSVNPQMASRVSTAFRDYKKVKPELRPLMKTELERIVAHKNLSKNTYEIISKILH